MGELSKTAQDQLAWDLARHSHPDKEIMATIGFEVRTASWESKKHLEQVDSKE